MPIYYATGSKAKAFLWSLMSGITEPLGGILGFAALQPIFTEMVFGIVFAMVGGSACPPTARPPPAHCVRLPRVPPATSRRASP